jgi:S-layer protein
VDAVADFTGAATDDTFRATASTLTVTDSLDGGAGVDTLVITDAAGGLNTVNPASVTLTSIEKIVVDTVGTLGKAAITASNAAKQVAQYTFDDPDATAATDIVAFTYGTTTGSFVHGATKATAAAAFAAALNTTAGAAIASVGTTDAAASAAPSGSTILTLSAANPSVKVGMLVTGTGIASGTTVLSVDGTAVILSKATTAAVTTAAVFGGGDIAVTVIAPTAGTALPAIAFTASTDVDDIPTTSAITANAAAVAAADAARYSFAGYTSVDAISAKTVGGANVGAASTQAVTLANTGGGATTVAGGLSQTVTTDGGAVTLSGSAGAVSLTHAAQGASAIAVTGGTAVTVIATGNATGTVLVGTAPTSTAAASGPSGAVSVSVSSSSGTAGAVTVNGGSSVSVAETATRSGPSATTTTASTTTQGAVTVNGTAVTTSVAVSQTAARDALNFRKAETGVFETVSVKFAALAAGASVTVEGLTFTASATGSGLTAAQVASAFAGLAIGAIAGKAGALGAYSGALDTTAFGSDYFTSGSATGDTVVFVSPTAITQGVVVGSSATASLPVATEVVKGVAAVTGNGQGGIANGAVTVTDVNFTPTGSTAGAGTGTKLGVIGTVTATNFTTLNVNNSGLTTLNVTGGSGNIVLNDTSSLVGVSVLRSIAVNMGGQTGGTLSSSTSNYETLNLALTSASAVANISMAGVTALNLSGSAALSATSLSTIAAVKTITLTGAAGLNGVQTIVNTSTPLGKAVAAAASLDLSTSANLTSVNASASTGAIKVTVDATKTTVVGGSGNDGVTTGATVSKSISTGAGNDTVTLGGAAISSSIDGGAGTDVLVMAAADAATVSATATPAAVFKSYVSGFEVLQLGAVTANTSVKLADIGFGANTVVAGVGASFTLTLDQFSNGGNLVIAAANAGTISLTNAVAFAATAANTAVSYAGNSANIEVTGRSFDTFDAKGDRTAPTFGDVNGGNVELTNVGTVNISAKDTGSSVLGVAIHSLTITDTKAHVVNVVGNADLVLSLGAGTVPATISASAMTGALTLDLGIKTLSGGFTVTGGAGDDNFRASTMQGDKLIGGAGDDLLVSNAFATTLTGGAGSDNFRISTVSAAKTIFTTIPDFSAGDTLNLIDSGAVDTFKATKTDLSSLGASATLSDAINLAITGAVGGEIRWLQFGGDTYVVQNIGATATTFTDGEDLAVKLSGTIDLSAMGFSSTDVSLSFA